MRFEDRRRILAELIGASHADLQEALTHGGMTAATAEKIVENAVGTYALPLGIALNFTINGHERLVPMVTEEPSVIAAASNASKMIRVCGGFQSEMVEELMTAQIQLFDVADEPEAAMKILREKDELLHLGSAAVPDLKQYGGGARDLEVRFLGAGQIVVHVHIDCVDAMGANLANTIAEAMGPRLAAITGGRLGLRILTNLADRRVVRAWCRVRGQDLLGSRREEVTTPSGIDVVSAIEHASRFAELDPYRAATHNKGIMNGVDAVVVATGNDWRAVEAGAHAYAARSGRYCPLATWHREGSDLEGVLQMPMALGTIGGTLRSNPVARFALRLAGIRRATDLCQLAACAGLASNLAALRALATEGIQRGHMSLHARSVAVAAGASGSEVEAVAAEIVRSKTITIEHAAQALNQVRTERVNETSRTP